MEQNAGDPAVGLREWNVPAAAELSATGKEEHKTETW